MSPQPSPDDEPPTGDPWAAFGYIASGVVFYGLVGWGVSVWLHASYWIPIGILVGAAFGLYMVFARYRFRAPATSAAPDAPVPRSAVSPSSRPDFRPTTDSPSPTEPRRIDASADATPAPTDERGETA